MDPARDPERLRTALERFRRFFDELRSLYLERDDVLDQAAMALLTREHQLISGPPGTAKSGLATGIVGRIVDEESGEPSLFARQLTESTVQTDLIGPIDFKALTETGRTEHFTDEGLLGAVHAHLDEVLDGRDMLLRSTLNLLHERELKQGTRIVRGAIECALMTTNRYLAEVLEDSRERLLAFVDRIAFVGFVPKGFADPAHLTQVLEVQAGGRRPPRPTALLTIQDVDALQNAVDAVHVDPKLFDYLARLLAAFEEECAEATRADPSFVPTRYLSTRTAVRLGRALKAACVLDAAWEDPDRPLFARAEDVTRLRLSLLLSGPRPDEADALLARETDPRERRQLEILRTERELFERCLERVHAPSVTAPRDAVAGSGADAPAADRDLQESADGAEAREEDAGTPAASSGAELLGRVLPAGLASSGAPAEDPIEIAGRMTERAEALEGSGGRDEARWLRGRALSLLAEGLTTADAALGRGLRISLEGEGHLEWMRSGADERLRRLERASELRSRLRARGADEDDPERLDRAVRTALETAREDLCVLWEEGFAHAVERAMADAPVDSLDAVLTALGPAFEHISETDRTLSHLGLPRSDVRTRVVGPRIAPLVARTWERFEASSRDAVVREVALLRDRLHAGGLRGVVPVGPQIEWALEALLRVEVPEITDAALDRDGYRALRAAGGPAPISYAAVQVYVELLSDLEPVAPNEAVDRLRGLLADLPEDLRSRLEAADRARIDAVVTFLEAFWERLEADALSGIGEDGTAADEASARDALQALHDSDFFDITTDEAALARFGLEAELLGTLLPDARDDVEELRRRMTALATRSRGRLQRILKSRAEARWSRVLGP